MNNTKENLPATDVFIDIPFFDVEVLGVVWFGDYAKYLEINSSALMETIDYGYKEMKRSCYLWPNVELRLVVGFPITDSETGEQLSKRHTSQVPVDLETGEIRLGVPPVLYRKLGIEP